MVEKVLPKLMSGHVIAYAGDLSFCYHKILSFFAGVSNSILNNKNQTKQNKKGN